MNRVFKTSLREVRAKSRYLPKYARKLIRSHVDSSRPNVMYWIYCLTFLIKYHEEDLADLARINKRVSRLRGSSVSDEIRVANNATLKSIKYRCEDSQHAIEACCSRLRRDMQ